MELRSPGIPQNIGGIPPILVEIDSQNPRFSTEGAGEVPPGCGIQVFPHIAKAMVGEKGGILVEKGGRKGWKS